MKPKKNSYVEKKVGCSKVKLYGGNTSACRHWFGRGAFPTSDNLSFSMDGSVGRLKEHQGK